VTLREKQSLFVELVARLIVHARSLGYELTFGECYRSDEQSEINALGEAGRDAVAQVLDPGWPQLATALLNNGKATGIRTSLHGLRLAIDLNLFRDGYYLSRTPDHAELGAWWEAQHPLCRWGGRFNDGNHYSLSHAGRA
jgi:hypothetical protein